MALSPPLSLSASLWRGRRVGLLGGSFNPAHEGHLHISLEALKRLKLDAVWWLVSPQNPLKPVAGMAALADRLAAARRICRDPRIIPTDIERDLGTRYTADTLAALKHRFGQTHFVWLMGADNLAQFHRWRRWQDIAALMPVAVLDRPPRGSSVRATLAGNRLAAAEIPEHQAARLPALPAPAWVRLHIPLCELSATAIRASARTGQ